MNIAYYISDYGYGHATRSIAIIRELLKKNQHLKIVICNSFAQDVLEKSLMSSRLSFRTLETDVGYIIDPVTLELDHLQIRYAYDIYLMNRNQKIKDEIDFLSEQNIECVISDIYSIAIEAADNLNIPSVGISNFLWSDVYKNIIDDSKLKVMRDAYAKMTYYLSLEGQIDSIKSNNSDEFNFFSREINEFEVNRIKFNIGVSSSDIVIFYGLGMKIDHNQSVSNLPLWSFPNCKFIVSSHININHPNVYKIPINYIETQNYVAASDITITKPGWSTVSEAVMGESNLLLIKRNSFIEDKNIIDALTIETNYHLVSFEDLNNLKYNDIILMKNRNKIKPISSGLKKIIKKLDDIINSYRNEELS